MNKKTTLGGTRLKQIRVSGFLARMSLNSGRRIVNSRRAKGRLKLTVNYSRNK